MFKLFFHRYLVVIQVNRLANLGLRLALAASRLASLMVSDELCNKICRE